MLRWLKENTAWLRTEIISSKNLDPENQFLLGGENGLRGYSVRQFSGPKRALVTLENRQVLVHDWLRLVSIGWAAFVDTGAVWTDTRTPPLNRFRSDVGVGLRFAPSRSFDPGLIRIDLAYALQENNKSSRVLVNIGADISFGEKKFRKFDQ
jgi:hemolysin activation/secretion protein